MIRIGLTGGIASGKSAAGRYLAQRGAHVLDADSLAHDTYAPGTPGFDALVREFGAGIAGASGAIDRAALGRLVFGRPDRLAALTAIVWPLTRKRVERAQQEQRAAGVRLFVVETPLLYEAGWQDLFDHVWLVRSPRDRVLQRLRDRGLSDAEAAARLAAATSEATAAARADLIIENDADLATLAQRIDAALQALAA